MTTSSLTDQLSDTLRRLYSDPADYIDSDHATVQDFAAGHAAGNERATAAALYVAVRDGIRYDPYVDMRDQENYRASSVLARGAGFCIGKASLYAAACRARRIPARVGFADVTNHLTTKKLSERMGTDVFVWHGFTEVYIDGAWRKATPTFNTSLCEKLGVVPLDFDGHSDALLHPFDGEGRAFMRYNTMHGTFHDVPAGFLKREIPRVYPRLLEDEAATGDIEPDAMRA